MLNHMTIALITLGFSCVVNGTASAQVTSPIVPDPVGVETIMTNGNRTTQTITIIGGRFFPSEAYARKVDTISFENQSDQVMQANHPDGAWSTGEIAPGESFELDFQEMILRALLADPLACFGQGLDCLRKVEFTTPTEPGRIYTIVRVFPNGALGNSDSWNAFWLVPHN